MEADLSQLSLEDGPVYDELLIRVLKEPEQVREKQFIFTVDAALENFVLDAGLTKLPLTTLFPPLNSWQRLLLHRLADVYNVSRELESNVLVLVKTSETRIPTLRLKDVNDSIEATEAMHKVPKVEPPVSVKIMSRQSPIDPQSTSSTNSSVSAARQALTFEEREAAYAIARERIFAEANAAALQEAEQDAIDQAQQDEVLQAIAKEQAQKASTLNNQVNGHNQKPPRLQKLKSLRAGAPSFDPATDGNLNSLPEYAYYPSSIPPIAGPSHTYNYPVSPMYQEPQSEYSARATYPQPVYAANYPAPSPANLHPNYIYQATAIASQLMPWAPQTMYNPAFEAYSMSSQPPPEHMMPFMYTTDPSKAMRMAHSTQVPHRPSSSSSSPPHHRRTHRAHIDNMGIPTNATLRPSASSSEISSSSSTCSSHTAASNYSFVSTSKTSVSLGPGLPDLGRMKDTASAKQKKRQGKSNASLSSRSSVSSLQDDTLGRMGPNPVALAKVQQQRIMHPLPERPAWSHPRSNIDRIEAFIPSPRLAPGSPAGWSVPALWTPNHMQSELVDQDPIKRPAPKSMNLFDPSQGSTADAVQASTDKDSGIGSNKEQSSGSSEMAPPV